MPLRDHFLLRRDICVSIVDVVTDMHFNLYGEALGDVAATDPTLGAGPPHIYAVTMRPRKPTRKSARRGAELDVWFTPRELGRPLPSIPLWLAEDAVTMLDLDPPYEDACRVLHIA